jgi:ABC-type dipeptide/oligopeptide/nickel transport system permease component
MLRYIARRLLIMIPVFLLATLLLFFVLYIIPGDPVRVIGGERAIDPATYQTLRAKHHLDRHWTVQYGYYMKGIVSCAKLQCDFGDSIQKRRPVSAILSESLGWSLKLSVVAIALEAFFGIVAGVISAVRKYSFLDTLVTVSTSVLVAIPVFWLGLMLQIVFGLQLQNTFLGLPISGVDAGFRSYILPAVTLASVFTAITARLTRTTMLEVMRQDYIRTASAKGLPQRTVIYKHALRNAMIPVVTNIGLDFGGLIGGAILTETVYSWPGIGRQVFLAIQARDNPIVIGAVIVFVMAFLLVNLIVDVSYAFLDPRIRYE